MSQAEKARAFAALHVKGNPLLLYNIWDAGSARAVEKAGAAAVATGSWSVAAAQGFHDGEALPLDLLATIVERIAATVEVPLSVDFEGGFADAPEKVTENTGRILAAGAIGVNFEDQIVGGEGLHEAARQAERIPAVRRAGDEAGIPIFINARTDLFLKEQNRDRHGDLVAEAVERAGVYARAGASGFFVPGLVKPDLIAAICQDVSLPVNIMMMPDAPTIPTLADIGVSRISYGPGPYREAVKAIADRFTAIRSG